MYLPDEQSPSPESPDDHQHKQSREQLQCTKDPPAPVFFGEASKRASTRLNIINLTDQHVAFKIKTNRPNMFLLQPAAFGFMAPSSDCMLDLIYTPTKHREDISQLQPTILMQTRFLNESEAQGMSSKKVGEAFSPVWKNVNPATDVTHTKMTPIFKPVSSAPADNESRVCRVYLERNPNWQTNTTIDQNNNSNKQLDLHMTTQSSNNNPVVTQPPTTNRLQNNDYSNSTPSASTRHDRSWASSAQTSDRESVSSEYVQPWQRRRRRSATRRSTCVKFLGWMLLLVLAIILYWSVHVCFHFSIQVPK